MIDRSESFAAVYTHAPNPRNSKTDANDTLPSPRCCTRVGAKTYRWVAALILSIFLVPSSGFCQQPRSPEPSVSVNDVAVPDDQVTDPNSTGSSTPTDLTSGMNLLSLLFLGGWFMIPLGLLSLLVVALAIERAISLRRQRLLPQRLLSGLGQLSRRPGGLDPREAYRVCQSHPSIASEILRNVVVKVGRPHAELEHALTEATQRRAIRLQQPVSWLSLAAAIAPLLGLLGTVWGITQAFYDTTQMAVGENRAEVLANGIYVALVTTIVGLTIAIPATILAHLFENRIVSGLNEIEEMVTNLLPQFERYEGQLRFTDSDVIESVDGQTVVQGEVPAPRAAGRSERQPTPSRAPY